MSDTVKLVIELPETTYQEVIEHGDTSNTNIYNAIRNGNPLSEVLAEIREEIKALDEGITSYEHDDPWIYKREALEVIDKHISGEGDSK